MLFFSKLIFSKQISQVNYQSVKRFQSRSGLFLLLFFFVIFLVFYFGGDGFFVVVVCLFLGFFLVVCLLFSVCCLFLRGWACVFVWWCSSKFSF